MYVCVPNLDCAAHRCRYQKTPELQVLGVIYLIGCWDMNLEPLEEQQVLLPPNQPTQHL